jgi:two-component system sensor histidine kinase/response regulator
VPDGIVVFPRRISLFTENLLLKKNVNIFSFHPTKDPSRPTMDYLQSLRTRLDGQLKWPAFFQIPKFFKEKILPFFIKLRSIGVTPGLDDFEKRKLGIFNQLNFFQLITGVVVPLTTLSQTANFHKQLWLLSLLPVVISAASLILNAFRQYHAALLAYFIFYPVLTCFIYINGMSLGVELNFILYGILSVFFLQEIWYMLFAIGLSMISYFVLSVLWKAYPYELENENFTAFIINQILAIIYIFYGLFLIKRENTDYQFRILDKNRSLHKSNLEIEKQREEIGEKALLLEKQAAALQELDVFKSKLFSIVSHDLKAPLYAMKRLFRNAQQFDMTGEEIKQMIPEVTNDLDATTALMENLLHWAKCQMHSATIIPQKIYLNDLVNDVMSILNLQTTAKQITIETKNGMAVHAYADKDMINLILRNLLSNAIKFTPQGGKIVIEIHHHFNHAEVSVRDSGQGISREDVERINQNNFYSTKGTGNEPGTGLGLMLCKEFLAKNGGSMMIKSEPGMGSTFSFTLPLTN